MMIRQLLDSSRRMKRLIIQPRYVLSIAVGLVLLGLLRMNLIMMEKIQSMQQYHHENGFNPSAISRATINSYSYISPYQKYIPAPVEEYVLKHAEELGYHKFRNPPGCKIWESRGLTPFHDELQDFLQELEAYSKLVFEFPDIQTDLRDLLQENPHQSNDLVCQRLELHPGGIPALFSKSHQISYTRAGYVEPLLPPMRHPRYCENRTEYLLRMDYMIHDFAEMCRRLRPHARTVFIDMGASLDYHQDIQSPAMYITKLYSKFGFQFDHIYAFEMSPKNASDVYQKVPDNFMASYHWINVGVTPDKSSKLNPLFSILSKFTKNDFIVVKLDVDTPQVELPLAHEILQEPRLYEMIDQFYFEHHVHIGEMAWIWRSSMKKTILSSLQLFHDLREKGVAAHFWP